MHTSLMLVWGSTVEKILPWKEKKTKTLISFHNPNHKGVLGSLEDKRHEISVLHVKKKSVDANSELMQVTVSMF